MSQDFIKNNLRAVEISHPFELTENWVQVAQPAGGIVPTAWAQAQGFPCHPTQTIGKFILSSAPPPFYFQDTGPLLSDP